MPIVIAILVFVLLALLVAFLPKGRQRRGGFAVVALLSAALFLFLLLRQSGGAV